MNVWHAVRHEVAGAWRSLRYDLDVHRASKLAGAFTEEFTNADRAAAPGHRLSGNRMIPLWGVAMLFVGGAAGAYLAIGGGLAAMGTDHASFESDRPGVTTWAPQPGPADRADRADRPDRPGPLGTGSRPAVMRRPGGHPAQPPSGPTVDLGVSLDPAVPESTPEPSLSAAPSASPTPSTSPAPSASASATTEGSEYRAPRAGR